MVRTSSQANYITSHVHVISDTCMESRAVQAAVPAQGEAQNGPSVSELKTTKQPPESSGLTSAGGHALSQIAHFVSLRLHPARTRSCSERPVRPKSGWASLKVRSICASRSQRGARRYVRVHMCPAVLTRQRLSGGCFKCLQVFASLYLVLLFA